MIVVWLRIDSTDSDIASRAMHTMSRIGALSAYTAEVFPTSMRSTAMGACSSISRLSSIINPTIWASLLTISDRVAVMAGGGALILGCFLILVLSETLGQQLEDHAKSK